MKEFKILVNQIFKVLGNQRFEIRIKRTTKKKLNKPADAREKFV